MCLIATVNLIIIQKNLNKLKTESGRLITRERFHSRSHSAGEWASAWFSAFPLSRLLFDFLRVFRELFATRKFSSTTDVREFATIFLISRRYKTVFRANVQILLSAIGAKGMNRYSYFWNLGRMSAMKNVDSFKVKAAAEHNQWISTS